MKSERPAIPMRSVLTVPVIVQRFVDKAPSSGADVIVLDLEDSIPPAEKAAARLAAVAALRDMPRGRAAIYARVNALTTGLLEDDLLAVVQPGLDGIILSKAGSPEMIDRTSHYLDLLERDRGLADGAVAIAPLIETAEGVANCFDTCRSSPRINAAVFGAEDFATDMGIARSREGHEVLWARTQTAIACHAAGITAIDTPDPDYTDEPYLEREMYLARSLGYRGKLVIHPAQVAIANRIFCPSPEEIAEARTVVEEFEREGLAKGRAAIAVGGKMIDTPIYWRAKHLLAWAATVELG